MKLTKSFIKHIIKEELEEMSTHPYSHMHADDRNYGVERETTRPNPLHYRLYDLANEVEKRGDKEMAEQLRKLGNKIAADTN